MELSSTLFGIAAMAVFVLPIIYLQGMQKKKEKKLFTEFLQLTQEKGLKLTHSEVWNYVYCLGLDTQTKQLIHFKKKGETPEIQLIDLKLYKKCAINKVSRTVKTNDGPVTIFERLYLTLTPSNTQSKAQNIEFYNADESSSVTTELPLLAKWEKQISEALQA
ncbi:hypothetical protein [Roseivirga sp.]|uniref:hypothetical protein n=1 Tax=Roseivirga sp. TaxID=1964215 RepID=UPI002B27ACED|nr:hypothetical protein [Roseivirga sp.]